jgi:inhibitor of Bruton tyrosine kinase
MKELTKYIEIKACGPKCRSSRHADELIGLITKSDDIRVLASGALQCWNCQKIHDKFGRTLLHVAASCGRAELCEWLLKYKKAEINLKTFENGWTPAHCAAFYGQIDCLLVLIKCGANLLKNDLDRMTPNEHIILDKWESTRDEPIDYGNK